MLGAGKHINPQDGRSPKEDCRDGYMGCYFSKEEIEKFEPTSSILLISIETLKSRPMWKGLGDDIYNILLSYKQDDPQKHELRHNGLDILQKAPDNSEFILEPCSPFDGSALSPELCSFFHVKYIPTAAS